MLSKFSFSRYYIFFVYDFYATLNLISLFCNSCFLTGLHFECFKICRSSSDESVKKERTLAMIKPDGLAFNHTDRVKTIILESGFSILQETIVQLDEDRAQNFYVEHSSKSFFSSLVKYMTR